MGVATKGPDLVASYLPKAISGQREQIEGEVVRKEREGNRLLLKVATAQGPILFTCGWPSWTCSWSRGYA